MKTARGLWPKIVAADNLEAAWRDARRGKRYRIPCATFELDAHDKLLRLERELVSKTYRPGRHRIIFIREPKRRAIAAAPFRDRIVHHALCRHLVPPLARSFIHDSYACRLGKGTHRAVLRYLEHTRRFRFRCHLDVRAFFASVDVDRLYALVARTIRDDDAMDLLARILDGGLAVYRDPAVRAYVGLGDDHPARCGLPVGNLTSQHLANVFLDGVDHHVKRTCKVRGYLRYMDDMTLFGDDPAALGAAAEATAAFLAERRGLGLSRSARVVDARQPARYLGWRITRDGPTLAAATLRKIHRRASALRTAPTERLERAVASWAGLRW